MRDRFCLLVLIESGRVRARSVDAFLSQHLENQLDARVHLLDGLVLSRRTRHLIRNAHAEVLQDEGDDVVVGHVGVAVSEEARAFTHEIGYVLETNAEVRGGLERFGDGRRIGEAFDRDRGD